MTASRGKEDGGFDLEQQFILRMPEEAAKYLSEDIDRGANFKVNHYFTIFYPLDKPFICYNT